MTGECQVEPLDKTVNPEDLSEAQLATLAVWGMGCPNESSLSKYIEQRE